jgi:hypothetical protein
MHQLEETRLAWQRAKVELEAALAEVERRVAIAAEPAELQAARNELTKHQAAADWHLARYISQLGKS